MPKVYLIEERVPHYDNILVGAVSDKSFAERYCRDMRTGGPLSIKEISLDELVIPKEKIYRVECCGYAREPEAISEAYHEFLQNEWNAYVEEDDDFMTVSYASLKCLRMVMSDLHGDKLCFWCYAKSASGARTIMKNTIAGFDASVLEWGVYHPMVEDSRELKRRLKKLNREK